MVCRPRARHGCSSMSRPSPRSRGPNRSSTDTPPSHSSPAGTGSPRPCTGLPGLLNPTGRSSSSSPSLLDPRRMLNRRRSRRLSTGGILLPVPWRCQAERLCRRSSRNSLTRLRPCRAHLRDSRSRGQARHRSQGSRTGACNLRRPGRRTEGRRRCRPLNRKPPHRSHFRGYPRRH